jgi:uncharacterized membrane protein
MKQLLEQQTLKRHSNELEIEETQEDNISSVPAQSPHIQEIVQPESRPTVISSSQPVVTAHIPQEPSYFDLFANWFKVDWPMKVGGLVLILGIGWFLIYAIQNNWIPAEMRILM